MLSCVSSRQCAQCTVHPLRFFPAALFSRVRRGAAPQINSLSSEDDDAGNAKALEFYRGYRLNHQSISATARLHM